MYYDGYSDNCSSNEYAQWFEIMPILTQASIKTKIVQINRL
jgi:hypothetical protein